jgi:hypothetical protein
MSWGEKSIGAKRHGAKRPSGHSFHFRKPCNENTLVFFPYYVIFNQHTFYASFLFHYVHYHDYIEYAMIFLLLKIQHISTVEIH